jgi:hypothetical protein
VGLVPSSTSDRKIECAGAAPAVLICAKK